MIQSMTMEVMK